MSRNNPSPEIRALAQRLIAYEEAARNASEANVPAVFSVSEQLRHPLSTLAGSGGFRSLLARALTLAKRQNPRLSTVQVKPDGSLEGLGWEGQDTEAGILLIAHLLQLLVTFIGEGLVMNLVLDSWPNCTGINCSEEKRS